MVLVIVKTMGLVLFLALKMKMNIVFQKNPLIFRQVCSFSLSYHTVCVSKHIIVKRTSLCVTLKNLGLLYDQWRLLRVPLLSGPSSGQFVTTCHCTARPLQHVGRSSTISVFAHGCFQMSLL